MKRTIALLLALVMALSLAACAKGGEQGGEISSEKTADGKIFADDVTLKVVIGSHASWPYEENWKVWQYIREAMGGKIEISAIPGTDFGTKFPLIMATPKDLPDVISFQGSMAGMSSYASQGAFLAFDDNLDKLPNYDKFWNSVPEDEKWMQDTRRYSDGKVYYAPIYGMERQTNVRAWLYRKDVFDKNNLQVPETMDDLYNVCKELKKLYPESYPLSMRSGFTNLSVIGASWKPYFMPGVYYDFNAEKWCYGATEDTMLEIITFINKMYNEKLVPPDFVTINAKSWQELVTTDRGFIMPEYQTRIDFFNPLARDTMPDFNLTAMIPPKANTPTGQHMIAKYNYDPMGFTVCNTGDKARIANAFKYVDWFYSDEGAELISWGKEGETYEVVDGKKQYIIDDKTSTAKLLYGFQTIGTYLRVDPEVADTIASEEQAKTTDMILEYTEENLNPQIWLRFNDEEDTLKADYETSIKTYAEEMLTKFMTGQEPLSNWDSFQAGFEKLPVAELLGIYEQAYNRVNGK